MKIKLIIWDLDDTLWKGTLDEGDVIPNFSLFNKIKKFNDIGVVNSICSKNDYNKAKNKLIELNMWEEFTMCQIAWAPKGQMVTRIIKDFQLREENVLFIDDNELNLQEVKFYNKKINVINIKNEQLTRIFEDILNTNSKDNRKRFFRYKILEKKNEKKKEFSDNKEFLRKSNITIYRLEKPLREVERIEELINRTNQLNFTKKRISKEEIIAQINNDEYHTEAISARDNFGDYGVIGYVALNKNSNELEQFVFSCRILNMGIENYIWAQLNYPFVNIRGEISTKLTKEKIDWIKEKNPTKLNLRDNLGQRALMIGGCDLFQLQHYLSSNVKIDTYFNYPNKNFKTELHRDSINFLFASRNFKDEEKNIILEYFPLAEKDFFDLPNFEKYNIIIYSPLIDYVQNQYQFKKNKKIVISWFDYTMLSNDFNNEKKELKKIGISELDIEKFVNNWEPIGKISKEDFMQKFLYVFAEFKGLLIVLTGASKIIPSSEYKYLSHHIELNEALLELYKNSKLNIQIVNVDELISSETDFTDAIRHYKRNIYQAIAARISEMDTSFSVRNKMNAKFNEIITKLSNKF